jgi:hypothetical protein
LGARPTLISQGVGVSFTLAQSVNF